MNNLDDIAQAIAADFVNGNKGDVRRALGRLNGLQGAIAAMKAHIRLLECNGLEPAATFALWLTRN